MSTELYYRLTCSQVMVTGTRETRTGWSNGEKEIQPSAVVELGIGADPRRPIVRVPRIDGSHELSLKLLPDGRLAAVNGTTAGVLRGVIEATIGLVSFSAGLIGAAIAPRLPGPSLVATGATPETLAFRKREPRRTTPEQQWVEQDPDGDATRLVAARRVLQALNDAIVERSAEMADTPRPASAYRRLLGVKNAISAVEEVITAINARREAWYNAQFRETEEHEFRFPTDATFRLRIERALAPSTVKRSDLDDGSKAAAAALEHLHVAIVEIRRMAGDGWTTEDAGTLDDLERDNDRGDLAPGIHFRVPRPAKIAIYRDAPERDLDDGDRTLTLDSVNDYWVVDLASRMGEIPFKGGEKLTASAAFAASGILETVSIDSESRIEALVEALKAAPKQATAGLSEAKTAVETWSALRSSRIERELKVLEHRKKQLEQEVAIRGLETDAASRQSLQQLKDRLARLKTLKDIGGLENPAAPDPVAEHDEERRKTAARLRTEVAIARAQQQLAAFPEDASS
jgi:hypothetical protein